MFFVGSKCPLVVNCPFEQVTVPHTVPFIRISLIALSVFGRRIVKFASRIGKTTFVKVQFGIQPIGQFKLNITRTIEIKHLVIFAVQVLILYRVSLIKLCIDLCKISAVGIIDRINGQHAIRQNVVPCLR